MRKIIIALLLSAASLTLAQNPEIKTDLPTIIPPSPTVAALMKFEEVPVSNYTGVPDISIPLFSSGTHSKDINLTIALKYHSASISANDRASDVGLGWSLFAGGTISRTVIGLPDEYFQEGSVTNKVGLYQTNDPNHMNNYYTIINNFSSGTILTNPANRYMFEEFLWEANEKGKYDTEHDLWQYNFMGRSGSFIIKKNLQTNQLEVNCIDDNRLKIINNYSGGYVPISFDVYDEKGYRYTFNVIEISNTTNYSTNSHGVFSNSGNPIIYNSAFHLSEVRDNNDKLLISFNYGSEENKEIVINQSFKDSNMLNPPNYDVEAYPNAFVFWEPRFSTSSHYVSTNTKKLNQIVVNHGPIIDFKYKIGRYDENLILPETNSSFLDSVIVKKPDLSKVKSFKFNYVYNKVIDNRMFLENVDIFDTNESKSLRYSLEYKFREEDEAATIGKDFWGYFNTIPCSFLGNHSVYKEVNPNYSDYNILQKMTLPTGGVVLFDYETNQYSYEGNTMLQDFAEEPNNHYNDTFILSNGDSQDLTFSNEFDQYATFYPQITDSQAITENRQIKLYKGTEFIQNLSCPDNNTNCCINIILEKGHQYSIRLYSLNTSNNNPYINPLTTDVYYYTTIPSTKQFKYGGGNRIKKIGYFSTDVDKDFFENPSGSIQVQKQVDFTYTFFDQPTRSSGSLVYSKPLYFYNLNKRACAEVTGIPASEVTSYSVYTDYNVNPTVNTQGSSVGYKNVTVSNSGNGKTNYTYTSPIDFPEDITDYYDNRNEPTHNYDYKRGLLLLEEIYDETGRILSKTENSYDYLEEEILLGMKVFYKPRNFLGFNFQGIINDCPISSKYPRYQDYLEMLNHCIEYPNATMAEPCNEVSQWKYGGQRGDCPPDDNVGIGACCFDENGNIGPCDNPPHFDSEFVTPVIICRGWCYTGNSLDFIDYTFDKKIKGWAKLLSKNTKNYFYDTNSTQNIVETDETYTYNPTNKQISESTVTNSNQGEILKTKYFYHTGNSSYSQNRISEIEKIETSRGSEVLSTTQINYANNWSGNASYLPQSIVTSKGNATLENRLIYELYDEYGNPLQLKQESGTVVTYIWGYNKTQPIAKIENATYAQVSSYVSNLQTLSNGTDEANLIIALNALRTALPNAMITTLTYIPLVGVHTITDPKGDIQTYEYDTFGRLKAVYDKDGYKLAENDYHYRTQN